MAKLSYTLTIDSYNVGLNNDTTITAEFKNGDIGYILKPFSVRYDKRMYHPGYIKLYCQITKVAAASAFPTHGTLKTLFNEKKVKLTIDGHDVANDYVVFKTEPVYTKDSLYVTFHIYSPDYWMTLSEYSKCFVHKRLAREIFETEAKTFGFTSDTIKYDALSFLSFTYENKSYEFIQPYLVQYNESFHAFITRTANRCGEAFYYEDGKLQLGGTLPKTAVDGAPELKSFESVTYCDYVEDNKVKVEDWSRNSARQQDKTAKAGTEHYSMEMAADEYLEPIDKDRGSSWALEFGAKQKILVRMLGSALTKNWLIDSLALTAADEAVRAAQAKANLTKYNHDYNAEFMDKGKYDAEQWKGYSKGESQVSQFGTFTTENAKNILSKVNINSDFYSEIRRKEMKSARELLVVEIGTTHQDLKLGSCFKYGDVKYAVVKVTGTIEQKNDSWQQSQHVEAVPMEKDKNYYFPLPLPEGTIRQSKPQVAYVTHNNDPMWFGRIRIRYPWQPKPADGYASENSSPWIRVASPMAFKGGGFCLRPQIDEEVMIDYIDGNVERPYVVAGMHSQESPVYGPTPAYHLNMSSPNGHFIRMKTPDDCASFISGFVPALSLAQGFFIGFPWGNLNGREVAGSIEIGDKYGIVGIDISTDNRDISVKSPFGTVGINAFHGITVSAPNGTIAIKGKNIEIAASNNLKITSGTNIKDKASGYGKQLKSTVVTIATKYMDLSLLRTFYEFFFRPIEGSFVLKSYRYMHIEAGNGTTTFPVSDFSEKQKNNKKFKLLNHQRDVRKLTCTIRALDYNLTYAVKAIVQKQNIIVWSRQYYKRTIEYYRYDAGNKMKNSATPDELIRSVLNQAKNSNVEQLCADDALYSAGVEAVPVISDAAKALCQKVADLRDNYDNIFERTKLGNNFDEHNNVDDIYHQSQGNKAITDNLAKMKQILPLNTMDFRQMMSPDNLALRDREKKCKRKLIHDFIKQAVGLNEGELLCIDTAVFNQAAIPDPTVNDDNWEKFIQAVKFVVPDKSTLSSMIYDKFIDSFYSDALSGTITKSNYEMTKWGTEQRGRILMSDDASLTLSFEKGVLSKRLNEDDETIHNLLKEY